MQALARAPGAMESVGIQGVGKRDEDDVSCDPD